MEINSQHVTTVCYPATLSCLWSRSQGDPTWVSGHYSLVERRRVIDGGREGSGGLGPAHETDARSSFQYFYQSFIDTLARLDPIKTLLFCELCSPFILQLARNL